MSKLIPFDYKTVHRLAFLIISLIFLGKFTMSKSKEKIDGRQPSSIPPCHGELCVRGDFSIFFKLLSKYRASVYFLINVL